MTPVELLRVGDRGWMVDLESARIPAVVESARQQPWAVVLQDIVPAARSILFCANRSASMTELATHLKCLLDQPDRELTPTVERDVVVVPVRYDGDDLEDVAEALGCTVADVVDGHTSAEHRVGFFGFAPGFAYIDGLPDSLRLPRRASPRPRVGQGMVAIAGTQTVVYPGGTPGGWHLIGRTSEVLWDSTSDSPSRLSVGDRVVFRAVTE